MKIYISGPMTGYADWNYPAFHAAAEQLRAAGHEVLSPAEAKPETDGLWADYLRIDLAMVLQADAVAVLPGWECSRGAGLEVYVAQQLSMTVAPIAVWAGISARVQT